MEVAAALLSQPGVGHCILGHPFPGPAFWAVLPLALPFLPGQETKGTPTECALSMDAAGSGSPAGGT